MNKSLGGLLAGFDAWKQRNKTVTFSEVEIGGDFTCNGRKYVKKSSRTALMVGGISVSWCFKQKENVTVEVAPR